MSVDNITIAIIWGRLVAVAEEMARILEHTAYSPAVREGRDFSTALFDASGRLLAQANRSPGHLGAMPHTVSEILKVFPADSLSPGDLILLNDPYIGSGHLPDCFSMSPAFVDDRLAGFVVSTVHVVDIGGMHAGGQGVVGVHELIQEGLRIPPVKLFVAGEIDTNLVRVIEANVRVPDLVLGDMRAQWNTLHTGATKLTEIVRRYGLETIGEAAEAFLDRSEAAVRTQLAAMPDGVFSFTDFLDDVGPNTAPVELKVTVTLRGGEITYDFTGSDPQTRSSINSTLSYTRAYCYWVTKAITTGDTIPQNAGQMRAARVVAPAGSFFNPVPPAAVGARAFLNQRIVELVFGALAKVIPDRVHAASGQWSNPVISGIDPRTSRPFVCYDFLLGGVGARFAKDGVSALSPVFSLQSMPLEVQESIYPIVVERIEMIPDSGGAGKHRGGLALRKDIRLLADVTLTNLTDRQQFAPYGLYGGEDGPLGHIMLNPGKDDQIPLHSKGVYELKRGDVCRFECSGSGGFGDPKERSAAAVETDVREGYVSREAALHKYAMAIERPE